MCSPCWNRPSLTNPARDTWLCGTKAGAGLIHAVVPSTSFRFKTLIFYRKFVARHFDAVMVRKCSFYRWPQLSQLSVRRIRFETHKGEVKERARGQIRARFYRGPRVKELAVIISGNISYLGARARGRSDSTTWFTSRGIIRVLRVFYNYQQCKLSEFPDRRANQPSRR